MSHGRFSFLVLAIASFSLLLPIHTSHAAITVSPSTLGNVFLTTGTVSIPVTVGTGSTNVAWSVSNYFELSGAGGILASGTASVTGAGATIRPTTNSEIGYFQLTLTELKSGALVSTSTTSFAILSPTSVSGSTINVATMAGSPFGVQAHFTSGGDVGIMPLMQIAGISNFRDEQFWNSIEVTKDTYTYPGNFTAYMADAAADHLVPLIEMDWSDQNYDWDTQSSTPQYTFPYTASGCQGYANYGANLLAEYSGQIPAFEIWDEPNGGTFVTGPATANMPYYYGQCLSYVWNTIHGAHPAVHIVSPSMVDIAQGFLEQMNTYTFSGASANGYYDTVSCHPYRDVPEGADTDLAQLATSIKAGNAGASKPIWATEFGDENAVSDAGRFQPVNYMVRIVAQMLSQGVSRMYYYMMEDNAALAEPYLGMIGQQNSSAGNYIPHPLYPAYANLIRQLYGFQFGSRITSGLAPTTYVYTFTGGTYTTYLCWAGSGFAAAPSTLTFNTNQPDILVTDIMGNQASLTPDANGNVQVPINLDPVYVTLTSGSFNSVSEFSNPVLADSAAGWSSTAGVGGWSYGYASLSGSTGYTTSAFKAMTWSPWQSVWDYRWLPSGATYPYIQSTFMEPYAGEWIIRRWTSSSVSGACTISGQCSCPNTNSVGMNAHILLNGRELAGYPCFIAPGATLDYSVPNVVLGAGTNIIDFAYDDNGNPNYGGGPYTARITRQSVTSPFTSWEANNFSPAQLADQSISGPTADPAGDGMSNLIKYAMNLNPNLPSAVQPVAGVLVQGGSSYVTFTYRQNISTPDLTVTYQQSPDLSSWTTATPATVTRTQLNAATNLVTAQFPLSTGQQFLRLKATEP